jgi:surfeit locus 1 family protein
VSRRFHIIPAIIVAAAVGTMIWLGFWQLRRAEEKEALLARYEAAAQLPAIDYPSGHAGKDDLPLYRVATAQCSSPAFNRVTAGRSASGEVGYVHLFDCRSAGDTPRLSVQAGWSRDPSIRANWTGGRIRGLLVPDSRAGLRLIASEPARGLQPSAAPSISDIPNNHRSYAVQWFAFAGIAIVIFLLAARGRRRILETAE